jgi:hypothetical protein
MDRTVFAAAGTTMSHTNRLKADLEAGKKVFFFEKKQKTFVCLRHPHASVHETARAPVKVFGSFFKKNFSAYPEYSLP